MSSPHYFKCGIRKKFFAEFNNFDVKGNLDKLYIGITITCGF